MILQNFTSSKNTQTMVVAGREAQDGQHVGLQVLGKQSETNVLGSASSSLGQTGCYSKHLLFQLHCHSHTSSFISLLIYQVCPPLTLSMSEC